MSQQIIDGQDIHANGTITDTEQNGQYLPKDKIHLTDPESLICF